MHGAVTAHSCSIYSTRSALIPGDQSRHLSRHSSRQPSRQPITTMRTCLTMSMLTRALVVLLTLVAQIQALHVPLSTADSEQSGVKSRPHTVHKHRHHSGKKLTAQGHGVTINKADIFNVDEPLFDKNFAEKDHRSLSRNTIPKHGTEKENLQHLNFAKGGEEKSQKMHKSSNVRFDDTVMPHKKEPVIEKEEFNYIKDITEKETSGGSRQFEDLETTAHKGKHKARHEYKQIKKEKEEASDRYGRGLKTTVSKANKESYGKEPAFNNDKTAVGKDNKLNKDRPELDPGKTAEIKETVKNKQHSTNPKTTIEKEISTHDGAFKKVKTASDGEKNAFSDSKYAPALAEKELLQKQKSDSTKTKAPEKKTADADTHLQEVNVHSEDEAIPSHYDEESLWYTEDNGQMHNLEGFFDEENSTISSSLNNSSLASNQTSQSKSSNCPACRAREEYKEMRKQMLKMHILRMLRMETLPNTTGVPIPKMPALAHLYDLDPSMMADSPRVKKGHGHHRGGHYDNIDDDEDDNMVKTQRVFTTAREAPEGIPLNLTDSLFFSPPVQLYTAKVRKAYLWFYIKQGANRRRPVSLVISRVLPESIASNRVIAKTVHQQNLPAGKAYGWRRIDVRDLLRRWLRHPMSNYGLQIRADDGTGENLVVLPPSKELDKGYEPWLDTKIIEPRSHSRHRRSQSFDCTEESRSRRCCRYPLELSFQELDWSWVIAPLVVRVDFCSGECHMAMQDDTPRSWMAQQVEGAGGSCCVATKMAPLSLLYFDNHNNILYQILQNVKVTKCGCQ